MSTGGRTKNEKRDVRLIQHRRQTLNLLQPVQNPQPSAYASAPALPDLRRSSPYIPDTKWRLKSEPTVASPPAARGFGVARKLQAQPCKARPAYFSALGDLPPLLLAQNDAGTPLLAVEDIKSSPNG